MSVKVMSAIWQHSPHKGSELLLLLALADNADDEGVAWPGQETLARKMRMSVRQVRRISHVVEGAGAFTTTMRRVGSKTQTIYHLSVPTGQDVPQDGEFQPDISAFRPDIAVSAESSLEPSEDQDQVLSPASPSKEERDQVWEALKAQFSDPSTPRGRIRMGAVQKELLADSSLTAAQVVTEIPLRARRYREKWPDADLTLEAFAKHWPDLREGATNGRRPSAMELVRRTA